MEALARNQRSIEFTAYTDEQLVAIRSELKDALRERQSIGHDGTGPIILPMTPEREDSRIYWFTEFTREIDRRRDRAETVTVRRIIGKRSKDRKPPRTHWKGAVHCAWVSGALPQKNKALVVSDKKFDRVGRDQRCIQCDAQFVAA